MAFTLNEISLILIAIGIGLVVGLMISGRGKYKRLWRQEQIAHRHTIEERDAHLNVRHEQAAAIAPTATTSRTADMARTNERDDLKRIRTISATDERTLNEASYHRYSQIAAMNDEQQATMEARLGRQPGDIAHHDWREQARLLDAGRLEEHERLHGRDNSAT